MIKVSIPGTSKGVFLFPQNVQTSSGAYPASYAVGMIVLSPMAKGWGK